MSKGKDCSFDIILDFEEILKIKIYEKLPRKQYIFLFSMLLVKLCVLVFLCECICVCILVYKQHVQQKNHFSLKVPI